MCLQVRDITKDLYDLEIVYGVILFAMKNDKFDIMNINNTF